MTIDKKIYNKKLQYDINREVAKTSALSSVNTNILQAKKIYLLVKNKS